MSLKLTILTPLGEIFSGEVDQVTATTTSGEITILKNHIPLVTTLATGEIMIRVKGEPSYFTVAGGVLEKKQENEVVVLSSRSEDALAIDVKRAEEAYQKAQALAEEAKENKEVFGGVNYQKLMNKELNRIRLGKRGQRK